MDNAEYQQVRVLLVEDNRIVQHSITTTLCHLGCHVTAVDSGHDAIALFSEQTFNLVYLDIGLPDMQGYEVVKALRQQEILHKIFTPIILLTAHTDKDSEEKGILSGADGVMSKPLSMAQAQQVINKCVFHQPVDIEGFYGKSMVDELPVIDSEHTALLMGVNKTVVDELRDMLLKTLSSALPPLKTAYAQRDYETLKRDIHKFHGGLYYAGVPRLERITSDLEVALYNTKEVTHIDKLYAIFFEEIKAVIKAHGRE